MDKRFSVRGVDAHTPLGEAAPAILRAKAKPLFALEDDARSGADADAVHDMRVASRRLREAMRLFGKLYQRRELKAWYRSIRTVTRVLGPVRDSDVFIDAFARLGAEVGEGGKRCVAFVTGYRSAQRERELERLNAELAVLDLADSRRSFKQLVSAPLSSADAPRPLVEFAYDEVARRAASVFGAQPAALIESNIEQQHALRIHYKRLRYAVEAFAPCYGESFSPLHEHLTAFQDVLGDLHDLHVFLDALRAERLVELAARAGISGDDFAEVDALLEWRIHETYTRFVRLVRECPAERLLPDLLLPLVETEGVTHASGPPGASSQGEMDMRPGELGPKALNGSELPPPQAKHASARTEVATRPKVALVVEFVNEDGLQSDTGAARGAGAGSQTTDVGREQAL